MRLIAQPIQHLIAHLIARNPVIPNRLPQVLPIATGGIPLAQQLFQDIVIQAMTITW
ncbi:hypothetical protein Hgul01_05063 [Herpetosiphon gulosus]|uniref:Uncharacterized protein n=1 Tax=Herpetosiphon gulosus TaxID=1973496 RepID=A0ABP9X8S0_9CHLR